MANYKNLMDIAKDASFQDRVKYALNVAAVAVMAEDAITANHAERVIYAKSILSGTASILQASIAFLTNPTIASQSNATIYANGDFAIIDSDFAFVINSNFNALAGVAK